MASPLLCLCWILPTIFLTLLGSCTGRPLYSLPSKLNQENRQQLQTFRPYNVAHRGSNGELPEETAAAYLRAIEEGADFIESDILATKDGALICFHDVYLDDTTDIAEHKEFAERKRTYEVQGSNITGFFPVDFTLMEIKTLRVKQRYSFRDQSYNGKFEIITFEEFIAIALDAPRIVGIYPEIKFSSTNMAHAHDLQVHPYTYRNEFMFLHIDFHQDPYAEYDLWINKIGIDELFTDFTGSLHEFQEWTNPAAKDDKSTKGLLHKIELIIDTFKH